MDEFNCLPVLNLPSKFLILLYRIVLWVETDPENRTKFNKWGYVKTKLKKLKCKKYQRKEDIVIPEKMEKDTLYLPKTYSGNNVLKQIRHAFCHNAIKYNQETKQIEIIESPKINITGSLSFDALKELVTAILKK